MMLHHQQLMQQQMMQQQPMMYMQDGYYPQWNEHVPPLIEAPHGHGVMTPYHGPTTYEDEEMLNEIEAMMDAVENNE